MGQATLSETRATGAPLHEVASTRPRAALLRSRARASLLLMVALGLLIQLPSIPLADTAAYHIWNGNDAHTLWQDYLSRPAPEVLFVGESSTRTDIDVGAVADVLSTAAGRRVTVGKFGLNGEGPDFYVAALYRLLHRTTRPRLVVLQVDVLQFTATDVLDPTRDMWLMNQPYDAGYLQTAYRVAPNQGRMVQEFAVPFFSTWPLIAIGSRCAMTTAARAVTRKLHLPASNLTTAPSPCEEGAHPRSDTRMTADDEQAVNLNYTSYLAQYQFSETKAAYLREAIRMVRSAGAAPLLMEFPDHNLEAVNPEAWSAFRAGSAQIGTSTGTPIVRLDGSPISDVALWADPAHLNQWGALAFAPVLARAVEGSISS